MGCFNTPSEQRTEKAETLRPPLGPLSQRTLLALPGALGEEELVLFVGEVRREESVHHGAETRGVETGSWTETPPDVRLRASL